MISLERIIETIRVKILNKPGTFGRLADAVGINGGNMGDIKVVRNGAKYITRDIKIFTKSPNQFNKIVEEIMEMKDVKLIKTFDEVYQAHEGGLLEVKSKVNIKSKSDYEKYLIPGIAKIAKTIDKNPEKVYEYTNLGSTVGLITNGSAVLNFKNDVNKESTYAVMEAFCAFLNETASISGIPIVLDEEDKDRIVCIIKSIKKSFGMIVLEDIASPNSIYIEEKLRGIGIPVIDINKYGNAVAVLTALINITKKRGKSLRNSKVGILGFGSKGLGITNLLHTYGVDDIVAYDIKEEAKERMKDHRVKEASDLNSLMNGCDIVIGASRIGGLIKFGMIKQGQIIMALSKPEPEIKPDIALKAGAAIALDGRLINPMLAIPGLIKGTLESRTKKVTMGMLIKAAERLSELAEKDELVPNVFDKGLHDEVAAVVKQAAIEDGVANLVEIEVDEEVKDDAEKILEKIKGVNEWMLS